MVKIIPERFVTIAQALRSLEQHLQDLQSKDPQYLAVKRLVKTRGCGEASILVLLNSLVSYKLKSTGEEYWTRFADYFSDVSRTINDRVFSDFLDWSGNTILKEQKLSRIRRVLSSSLPAQLIVEPLSYCSKISLLVDLLSKSLRSSRESKTISFAAKMYGYVCYACGVEPDYSGIGIPLDYRTAVLTLTSCLVDCDGALSTCVDELLTGKHAKSVREAWNVICSIAGIPCLQVDTLTWLVTGVLLRNGFDANKSLAEIKSKYLISISSDILELFSECASKYVRKRKT